MDDTNIRSIAAWLVEAGLAGMAEADLLDGFCRRCCTAGLDVARSLALVDTLHPNFEGRAFRWRFEGSDEAPVHEYGRTLGEAAEVWQQSVFFDLWRTGRSDYVARYDDGPVPYAALEALRPEGYSSLIALVHRFAGAGVFGGMDCVYSYYGTRRPGGFAEADLAALRQLSPTLALALKSASLARITSTLAEVYLGRGAGRRVLAGEIERGIAERIETVLWFSDLRGFSAITDRAAPDDIIPLLNDYAGLVITAVEENGGDVLKLIGDGILGIFESADPVEGCRHALLAERRLRERLVGLNAARAEAGRPVTSVYLGLHFGEVFYGNIGSISRLDFTVVGPAVNEVNRIVSLCRSVDRSVLMSERFAALIPETERARLASVGRYALRGIRRAQDLYTLDDGAAEPPVLSPDVTPPR